MIYLDHAATGPVRRSVLEAMWPFLTGEFGNPSSTHGYGERAAAALEGARSAIADGLGWRPAEVILTSGGTEADNLAVKGLALARPRGRHIVTSAAEHEAVLESCHYLERFHGFTIDIVPVDGNGLVAPDRLAALVRDDTTLVSIQHANNEIGTVQPIAELAGVARAHGALMHTDAVQSAGWLDVSRDALAAHAVSVSGHKLGAPKGVGALLVRRGVAIEPLVHGGGQERGRRSGTENVAGAVGLGEAVRATRAERRPRAVAAVRDEFIRGVIATVPGARLTGHARSRLPDHASFVIERTSGEAVLLELEARGVTTSSGSACAAGRDEPSAVLLALGLDADTARTAVRFTLGDDAGRIDVAGLVDAVAASVRSVAALQH